MPVHTRCPSGRCCWLQEEKDLVVPSSQHGGWREAKSEGRTKVGGGGVGVGTPGFSSQGWPFVVSRVMVPQRLPHPNPQNL